MKYNSLDVESKASKTRKGRGISAGKGKTAGRGTKGQNARSGGGVRPGFEGGQQPMMQRIPKLRGFRSVRPKTENVKTSHLNSLSAAIDTNVLSSAGLITSPHANVKIIYDTEISKKVNVKAQGATKTAVESIEKAGGSFEKVPRLGRKKQEKPKK